MIKYIISKKKKLPSTDMDLDKATTHCSLSITGKLRHFFDEESTATLLESFWLSSTHTEVKSFKAYFINYKQETTNLLS